MVVAAAEVVLVVLVGAGGDLVMVAIVGVLTAMVAGARGLVVRSAAAGPGTEVSEARGVVVAMLAVLNDAGALVVVMFGGVPLV